MKQFRTAAILTIFVLLSACLTAFGQVEPDTVQRKRELPTGPPAAQPQPRTQPKVQQPPKPVEKETPQEGEKEKLSLNDRLYTGGSFGLQFGTYTNIALLPILGYKVTEKFSVGTGIVYNYIKSGNISLSNYGGRAFAQVEALKIGDGALLAHAETEALSSEYIYDVDPSTLRALKRRSTVLLPMAGVGYRQRMGERASFDLLLLYNLSPLTQNEGNPYNNPVFRAGFNIPLSRR